jgi:hypothetical protein
MSSLIGIRPGMNAARAEALAAAIAAFPTLRSALDDLVSASMEAGLIDLPGAPAGEQPPREPAGFVVAWDAFFAARA